MPSKKANKVELQPRPPVVVIVGHVDHGKTTLLDFIRKANVAEGEAGGITQAISSYEIEHEGNKITFIDTPGHEAFSMMREHGAKVADVAILVVAATEGVKPQTTEAIKILTDTKTPFIVAFTKSDMPSADLDKVKGELLSAGVLLEGVGGNISWQAVSGKTGEGVSDLLGLILLTAEMEELKFDPSGHANGFVLEAQKDSRRGIVAQIVLKNGVLRIGDEIVTRGTSGKVKIMENFLGKPVKELLPSSPATIGVFESLPKSGDEFWADEVDIEVLGTVGGKTSDELIGALEVKSDAIPVSVVKAVLKADSVGSLEALKQVLGGLIDVTDASVGDISDNDVKFAKSTGSIIMGFKVKTAKAAERLADVQKIKIITSEIIYRLEEEIEALDLSELESAKEGKLEVLKVFSESQSKKTIGGKVVDGMIVVGSSAQIIRDEDVIGRGRIKSLEQNKSETNEVLVGNECGLVITTDVSIKVGDIIKASQ